MILEDDAYIKERVKNTIQSLCRDLDFLTSPDIEEKMVCTLDCCTGNDTWPWIEKMINDKDVQPVLGDEGLDLLRELYDRLDEACYYDDEKGFSKQQRWLEFADFANTVNIFLKNVLKNMDAQGKSEVVE